MRIVLFEIHIGPARERWQNLCRQWHRTCNLDEVKGQEHSGSLIRMIQDVDMTNLEKKIAVVDLIIMGIQNLKPAMSGSKL